MPEKAVIYNHADSDGHFRRKDSSFRHAISNAAGADFPAASGRYAIYINWGCPWAHRVNIVAQLKGLIQNSVIQLIVTDFDLTAEGWLFTGREGSDAADPLYGFTKLSQLYYKADPEYTGRFTVPVLWDKQHETIVNNESSEIIRMLYSSFDAFLPPPLREGNRPGGGHLLPDALRAPIDEMNDWVYTTVNNGVYKCGFATTQAAYEAALFPLFESLDRLEAHLAAHAYGPGPFLFGAALTEADVRLYVTLIRFDVAYVNIFNCNLRMIRHDYPRLSAWLRNLYWDAGPLTNGGVFHNTTFFDIYKWGYLRSKGKRGGDANAAAELVVPKGPAPDIYPALTKSEREQWFGENTEAAVRQPNGA